MKDSASPRHRLAGRLIALGVTGSIAAYKAPELVRRLQDEGAEVVALLTPSATRFVAPLALEALTRRPVEHDVLALLPDGRIGHIVAADAADAVVVAPATAHWLGSMATGLAGDVVTATCLATSAPVVVAPAMDGEMYAHPATRANVARLRDEFGYTIVEPEAGPLASGQSGVGRLAEIGSIVDAAVGAIGERPIRAPDDAARPPRSTVPPREADLAGRRIVVTAGGTAEAIDPVRFIGNRSTGRMGAALAQAALDRGAFVTLIAGRTEVPLPEDAETVFAESTSDMEGAVIDALDRGLDVLIMAAAVADFRPRRAASAKLTREAGRTLELEPTPDILAAVGARVAASDDLARPVLVGFAAETGSTGRAAAKLERKQVDLIVANDVTEPGSGFGTETNRVTIHRRGGSPIVLPLLPKREVADRVLDLVTDVLDERDVAQHTDPVEARS